MTINSVNWQELMDAAGTVNFEPLPDGPYPFVITEATPKQSSNGKLMFAVTMQVEGGPHDRRKLWNNFVLSPENPNAMTWFFRNMDALGLDRNYFAGQPTPQAVAQALIGRRGIATVGTRAFQGEMRNEVKGIQRAAGAAPTAAAGNTVPIASQTVQTSPAPAPQAQVAPPPTPAPAPAPAPAPVAAKPEPAPAPEPAPEPAPQPQPAATEAPVPQPAAEAPAAPPPVPF